MRRIVASGLGVGLLPHRLWGSNQGAGTFGTALAALVGWALWPLDWWWGAVVAVAAIGVSLWAAAPFSTDGQDPGWVAIDEVAGTFVAMIGLSGWPWALAIAVFRIADITKALPGMKAAERLHGAVGVTADDVLAGLYGLAAGVALTALV